MFDFIVVGAGFAGAVIAERIASVLGKKVLIIEKRPETAGNCRDYKDESGVLVHKYGPHLFHTDNKTVFDYLSQFTDWHLYQHRVSAFIDGQKVPLPFNFNSIDMLFSGAMAEKLKEKLLQHFSYNSKVPILELKALQDSDLKFLADYVYEKVFLHYTIKQWGLKPEEIDSKVTGRVPVYVGRDNRYFNDTYQAVPLNGYYKLFERMLNRPEIKLMLNTDFKEVLRFDFQNKAVYFLDTPFEGKVIFTGMLDELFEYKFGALPYRSLDLKFETLEQEFFQESAVVNYPNDYDFTRITEFKHIHPCQTPNKTIILKEYPKAYSPESDIPYYPVFTSEAEALYKRYRKAAADFKNVILLGRLADFRYYDMDDVVAKAFEVFENCICRTSV